MMSRLDSNIRLMQRCPRDTIQNNQDDCRIMPQTGFWLVVRLYSLVSRWSFFCVVLLYCPLEISQIQMNQTNFLHQRRNYLRWPVTNWIAFASNIYSKRCFTHKHDLWSLMTSVNTSAILEHSCLFKSDTSYKRTFSFVCFVCVHLHLEWKKECVTDGKSVFISVL